MSSKLWIILIVTISFTSVGFYWLSENGKSDSQIQIDILSKTAALPVRSLTSFEFDEETFDVSVTLFDALDSLLVETENTSTAHIRVMDTLTYLEYYSNLSDYRIIAMQPKDTSLIVNPEHADIKELNAIKGAILGISSQASDEFLLRMVIDSENIIGLSLDEVSVPSPLESALMISDNLINLGLFESPYTAYTLSNGCKSYYNFTDDLYDVYLVPKDLDSAVLEKITAYLKALNRQIDTYQSKSNDEITHEMTKVFGKYAIESDHPTFYNLVKPNTLLINRFVTYLYATNWIDNKYPYDSLALDVFN